MVSRNQLVLFFFFPSPNYRQIDGFQLKVESRGPNHRTFPGSSSDIVVRYTNLLKSGSSNAEHEWKASHKSDRKHWLVEDVDLGSRK
jgi:hypothetical protein